MCRTLFSVRVSPAMPAAGRWPFWRLGGLQEPGSVFFSLLNLLAHYCGLKALQRVPADKCSPAHSWCATASHASTTQSILPYSKLPRCSNAGITIFIGSLSRCSYVGLSLVSMNAWFWASVFHSRDRPVTEALDYHSATAVQFTAAVAAAVRVFELSPKHRYGCTVGLLHVFFGLRRHGIVCCGVPTQRRARDS